MSYIPDCRTDENYNQDKLSEKDREFLDGFDWAVEQLELALESLDIYWDDFDIEGVDINLVRFLENHPDVSDTLGDALTDYLEMQRNDLIVSMIESMPD